MITRLGKGVGKLESLYIADGYARVVELLLKTVPQKVKCRLSDDPANPISNSRCIPKRTENVSGCLG